MCHLRKLAEILIRFNNYIEPFAVLNGGNEKSGFPLNAFILFMCTAGFFKKKKKKSFILRSL